MSVTVKHLDHLNLTVRDLDSTEAWYRRLFGFRRVEEGVRPDGTPWRILRAGEAMLCIYEKPDRGRLDRELRAEHGHHGVSHFGLRITDRAAWEATIEREGVTLSLGPYRWEHSVAWYVTDPTGYEVEVAWWKDDTVAF